MYYGNPMYAQNNERISVQQAIQIALGRVSGQVVHVDLDMEDGLLVYEVFIMTPENRMYEVEINARTGRIVKVEQERDDDLFD